MTFDFGMSGRVVIIGGAGGGGIGSATAITLARAGAHIVAVDRNSEAFEAIAAELRSIGRPHLLIERDLMQPDAAEAVLTQVASELGPVHGVVNVIGGFENQDQMAPLLDAAAQEHFFRLIDFNLKPALALSRAAAAAMAAAGHPGSIVQITSSTGVVSMPFGAGYAAGKAALINLTRTMAVEWGNMGIRVNAIACGSIMSAEALRWAQGIEDAARRVIPLGRCGRPEEIASAALFLVSELGSYVTGEVIRVDGGALARAPYNDENNIPVFITDPDIHSRLTSMHERSRRGSHAENQGAATAVDDDAEA